jgi:hypothetical protein
MLLLKFSGLWLLVTLFMSPLYAGSQGSPFQPSPPYGQSLEQVSAFFLGAPFRDGALGEGAGSYDADPFARMDAFDCTTFVETVWAIARNHDQGKSWIHDLQAIRYGARSPSFANRLHFISLDWVPYHVSRGVLKDVTRDLGLPLDPSVTVIDRKSWYRTLHPKQMPHNISAAESMTINYLPFKQILAQPQALIEQIKISPLLVNFVRPNWEATRFIGTRIDITHQGFLFLQGSRIILRHASVYLGKVGDEDFLEYAKRRLLHQSMKGVQLLRIEDLNAYAELSSAGHL